MKRFLWYSLFFCLLLPTALHAQLETRLYSFENTPAEEVEARIRELVPDGPRVLMNAEIRQVMVVADPDTHRRIDQLLQRVDRPVARLNLWMRHNRDEQRTEILDGAVITLPVAQFPPAEVVKGARQFLDASQQQLPVVGTVLQAHVSILSESPPIARLRVTPVVLFGITPPYETVQYTEFTSDLRLNNREFLDIPRALSQNDFYRRFLRGHPDPALPDRPVSLLLSLEGLSFQGRRTEEDLNP